jgi:hypothetical protein
LSLAWRCQADDAVCFFQALRGQAAFCSIPVDSYERRVVNALLEFCQQHLIGLDFFGASIGGPAGNSPSIAPSHLSMHAAIAFKVDFLPQGREAVAVPELVGDDGLVGARDAGAWPRYDI